MLFLIYHLTYLVQIQLFLCSLLTYVVMNFIFDLAKKKKKVLLGALKATCKQHLLKIFTVDFEKIKILRFVCKLVTTKFLVIQTPQGTAKYAPVSNFIKIDCPFWL